jgi:hypothetical protein
MADFVFWFGSEDDRARGEEWFAAPGVLERLKLEARSLGPFEYLFIAPALPAPRDVAPPGTTPPHGCL